MPQLNGASGLILEITGRDSGPYVNVSSYRYVWDPAALNEYAAQIRQRYYNASDQVFGVNFAELGAQNGKLAQGLRALGSINGLRVQPNAAAVTDDGNIDPGAAIQSVRAVRAKYDKITSDNASAAKAVAIAKPEVSGQMQTWQEQFYRVLTDVQTQVSGLSGIETVNVSQAISKLREAQRKWEGLARRYLDARDRIKHNDAMKNVRMAQRFAAGLSGVGTAKVMEKPKPLLDAWMRENDFDNLEDVIGFANEAIQLAETESGKLAGGEQPGRNA
jgi:hypothetical protein